MRENLYRALWYHKQKGMKMSEVAKKAGISPNRLSLLIHRGKCFIPSEQERKALAAVLEVPAEVLFNDELDELSGDVGVRIKDEEMRNNLYQALRSKKRIEKISFAEIAKMVGINRKRLWYLFKDKKHKIKQEEMESLSRVLDISLKILFD